MHTVEKLAALAGTVARIDVPGAVVQQKSDFGDATGYGMISGESFSSALERNSCFRASRASP